MLLMIPHCLDSDLVCKIVVFRSRNSAHNALDPDFHTPGPSPFPGHPVDLPCPFCPPPGSAPHRPDLPPHMSGLRIDCKRAGRVLPRRFSTCATPLHSLAALCPRGSRRPGELQTKVPSRHGSTYGSGDSAPLSV